MTLLFISVLAAFALLALVIMMLVRTTALRAWQGVLLFILPLVAANLIWFSWLHPRQAEKMQMEAVAQQLSAAPGYRLLKVQEPELWQLLNRELRHKLQQGVSAEQALGDLRGWLTDIVNKRMTRASDDAVIAYVQVSVEEMQALQQQSPQRCFQFLYPQVSGGINLQEVLTPALYQRDGHALEALLLSSQGAEQQTDQTLARRDLREIVDRLYGKWGNKLQQLNQPADTAVDRSALCAMSIDLYSAILALPAKRAAGLLRNMVHSNG